MKHRPFIEIIDFNAELKEYKYLCRRKSKKFTYYLDWKKHMFSLIEKFEDKNDLENFKYFCRNRERSTRSTASTYLSLIIMFATVCIDNFIVDINLLVWILIFFIIIGIIVWQNNAYEKENYFYKDILEIIQEVESKKFNFTKKSSDMV